MFTPAVPSFASPGSIGIALKCLSAYLKSRSTVTGKIAVRDGLIADLKARIKAHADGSSFKALLAENVRLRADLAAVAEYGRCNVASARLPSPAFQSPAGVIAGEACAAAVRLQLAALGVPAAPAASASADQINAKN